MISSVTAFRTFIAGTGASGALLGSALVSFLLVAGFLAVDELPIDSGSPAEIVSIGGEELGVGTPGGLAVAGAPGAVVAAPVLAAASGAAAAAGGGTTGTDIIDPVPPNDPNPPTPPNTNGPLPPSGDPGISNPINQALAGVDKAVQDNTGINPGLSQAAEPVTGAVDDALEGATGQDLAGHVDGVSGTLGQ